MQISKITFLLAFLSPVLCQIFMPPQTEGIQDEPFDDVYTFEIQPEVYCAIDCSWSVVADGICDEHCLVSECLFDFGDCEWYQYEIAEMGIQENDGAQSLQWYKNQLQECEAYSYCPVEFIGDGVCDSECLTSACFYDRGDCADELYVENLCQNGCFMEFIGDGFCDEMCNTNECSFDGGDCLGDQFEQLCAEGCFQAFVGDGLCDIDCNITECAFDGGDCALAFQDELECAQGCYIDYIGDGLCDPFCNNEYCYFDGGDCTEELIQDQEECAPGCLLDFLGDLICDEVCLTEDCGWDLGDCDVFNQMLDAYVEEDTTNDEFQEDNSYDNTNSDIEQINDQGFW